MSRVRADRYTDRAGTGSPTFSEGVNVVGVSSLGITTVTGVGQTALTVNGDARITGVLTIGQGSVTIDGTSGSSSITGVTTAGIGSVYGVDSINDLGFPTAGPLSNRNLVINGAMEVAQRGTSETGVTGSGIYTADRWKLDTTDEAIYTIEQSSDSPAGFKNSLKFTVTSADGSVAADDYSACHYLFEGNDTVSLGFGASGAKSFTLSFYVKSSQTGTFGLSFQNADNSRNFDSSYTINTADTWERKTITIPGDTSGTWLTTTAVGLKIWWSFLVGSTYEASSVSTSWGGTLGLGLNGQVQLSSILNATWQITGVQLEVGTRATPFEHRGYADEFVRCERYYQTSSPRYMAAQYLITNEICSQFVPFKPEMRATPSPTYDSLSYRENTGSFINSSLSSNATLNKNGIDFVMTASGAATSDSFVIYMQGGQFDAEL